MKKSTKLISLILSIVMAFSFVPVLASAGAVPSNVTTVEGLIQNDSLATIVDWLIKNLDSNKESLVGAALRLVFSLMKDEAEEGYVALSDKIGTQDPTALTDEQNAKILLDWLDANLPTWTKDINSQDWYKTVNDLGITLDLKSVNGVLNTVYGLGTGYGAIKLALGDVKNLTADALKVSYKSGLLTKTRAIQRSDGDLKVVYALFDWIEEISPLLEKFIKGGIGNGGLNIGSLADSLLGDSLADINAGVNGIEDIAKSYIYQLIDGYAEAGEFKKDLTKGDWGKSAYKDYTADQLLAAALIRVCGSKYNKETGKIDLPDASKVISKTDCNAALKLSVYGILAKYGQQLYTNLAVDVLNTKVKEVFVTLNERHPNVKIYNYINKNYKFTSTTFSTELKNISKSGILGQLNNILVKAAKTMLTSSTYTGLKLKTGTNEEVLNANLTNAFRLVLPILNTDSVEAKFGFKFDEFTTTTVKKMDLETMAAAVLKIFFPAWFEDECKTTDLKNAKTLEQLGTLAVYYTFKGLVTSDDANVANVAKKAGLDKITLSLSKITTREKAYDTILGWSGKTAAYAIASIPAAHYTAPTSGSYTTYLNNIINWGLKFISGIPACNTAKLQAEKNMYKKADVVLNSLVDLHFINNCNGKGYVVDVENLIFDGFLGNVLDFNIAGVLGLLAKNDRKDNLLNKTPINAVLGLVDKLFTAVFTENEVSTTAKADIDKNGKINITDAQKVLNQAVKVKTFSYACDVNYDGSVTVDDARTLLRYVIAMDADY